MHLQTTKLSAFAVVAIFGIAGTQPTRAEISSLSVTSAKDIGPFRDKPYREVEAQLRGTAPGGAYSVPVTIAFPKKASDHNGFTVVDVDNTITVGNKDFPGGGAFPMARASMAEEFLFGRGNAHVGVIWEKFAVETLGNGTIAAPSDAWTIIRDTATFARNPAKYLPSEAGSAPPSGKVVAYGFSQTGEVLRGWYFNHMNTQTGKPVFDGALIGGADGSCYGMEKRDDLPCAGPLDDGGKVVAFLTETDAELGGDAERGDNPNYRVVETAGVSHIPASLFDFRSKGFPQQNPVSYVPPVRAALVNLQEWVNGREPPPSVAIALSDAPAKNLECCGAVKEAKRDADGNAVGGVRLPHMTSVLNDGKKAGAPLGQYTGVADDEANLFFTIAGVFKPFPPDKLKAVYPTRAAYTEAVTASANDLVAKRYILPEDAEVYIDAAKHSDIGQQ